jgi:cysteine desulfurase family protein (TIGR01976 family)
MELTDAIVDELRGRFPALARRLAGQPVVYLDGPGGTQVPRGVIEAVSFYLSHNNANHGGLFATSRESDAMLREASQAWADVVGTPDPGEIVFGPNMTTLTFALSRALAKTWLPGDEVVVTRLDHDANVSPWVLAARDARATVHYVEIHPRDATLNLDDLQAKLSPATRLVAVGCASNASGSVNPVKEIAQWAHAVGARVFLDAVHHAPHALIDVVDWDCDFLACSAYKLFGPHVGILWGRRNLLETLPAYKVRPAPDVVPDKWMTGTQNHEGIAGTKAAIDYLMQLGRQVSGDPMAARRAALGCAMDAIGRYERRLSRQLLAGLATIPDVKVWGITQLDRLAERVPTVSLTHARLRARELAEYLGHRGFFVWHGNYYAPQLTESLGLEPEGMVRIGLVHYNTSGEIDRLLDCLRHIRP